MDWPAQLVSYGLWAKDPARRIAVLVRAFEIAVAGALLALGFFGIAVAGALFLAYGITLGVAAHERYDGACGCSATGRVDRPKILRAFAWGVPLLVFGFAHATSSLLIAGVLSASTGVLEFVAILASIAVAPGPRMRRSMDGGGGTGHDGRAMTSVPRRSER